MQEVWKVYVKKTELPRLGINGAEEVILTSYLNSTISKNGGCRKDVKTRLAKAQNIFS